MITYGLDMLHTDYIHIKFLTYILHIQHTNHVLCIQFTYEIQHIPHTDYIYRVGVVQKSMCNLHMIQMYNVIIEYMLHMNYTYNIQRIYYI